MKRSFQTSVFPDLFTNQSRISRIAGSTRPSNTRILQNHHISYQFISQKKKKQQNNTGHPPGFLVATTSTIYPLSNHQSGQTAVALSSREAALPHSHSTPSALAPWVRSGRRPPATHSSRGTVRESLTPVLRGARGSRRLPFGGESKPLRERRDLGKNKRKKCTKMCCPLSCLHLPRLF